MRQTFKILADGVIRGGLLKVNVDIYSKKIFWSYDVSLKFGIISRNQSGHGFVDMPLEALLSECYKNVGDHFRIDDVVVETTARALKDIREVAFSYDPRDFSGRCIIDISEKNIKINSATLYAAFYGLFMVIKMEAV